MRPEQSLTHPPSPPSPPPPPVPSVPVQLQVVSVQEVRGDAQRGEPPRGAGHGEVQPLHVVQRAVVQVEGGGGRGLGEAQLRGVHGGVGLVQELALELLHQPQCPRLHPARQRALQEGLQLVVGGQGGQAGGRVQGQGGRGPHLHLRRGPRQHRVHRQSGDAGRHRQGLSRGGRVLPYEGGDLCAGDEHSIYSRLTIKTSFLFPITTEKRCFILNAEFLIS